VDWIQVLTIIGSLGALMIYLVQRMDKDIDKMCSRMDGHATRIDQLYVIIIDLLKKKN
jgi:hypothetical protein